MFTGTGSIHDLVIVVAYLGALCSGYAGMTVWERKGGRPGGGFSSAGCWAAMRRITWSAPLPAGRVARDLEIHDDAWLVWPVQPGWPSRAVVISSLCIPCISRYLRGS
jgi:hypothetical protein